MLVAQHRTSFGGAIVVLLSNDAILVSPAVPSEEFIGYFGIPDI